MFKSGKQMLPPVAGTEIKLAVSLSIPGMDSLTMDDYDFTCDFFISTARNDVRSFAKADMIRADESHYLAVLDTAGMKPGMIYGKVTARIPDADCKDNYRTEVAEFNTGVQIFKRL